MMEKDLEWNKQQDLDDENQEVTHNIEFLKKGKKYTLQQWSITFGMLQGQKWVSTRNQTFPKIEKKSKSSSSG